MDGNSAETGYAEKARAFSAYPHEKFCIWSSLLLLTDGEAHSDKAEGWTMEYASMNTASVTVLHVIDPYLKQFYNEIYSQGRKEYLEHVEKEINLHGEKTMDRVRTMAKKLSPEPRFLTSYGDPLKEICREVKTGQYDLVVTGGKKLSGINAFKSWDLPSRLSSRLSAHSMIIIRV